MEKKTFGWWVVFILLFIWQLPQNIVALILMLFTRNKKLIREGDYCFCFQETGMGGGISLGSFCLLDSYLSMQETSIAHELYGHTVDSKILGPLYLIVIGIPSILNAGFHFTECYYDFYTEKLANFHANLTTDGKCRLKFKDYRN